jgi:hypothetical protein
MDSPLAAVVFHAVSRPPAEQDEAQAASLAAIGRWAAGATGDGAPAERMIIWRGMVLWVVVAPASRMRALAALLGESRLALARGGPVVCTADAVVPCDVRACVLEGFGLDVGDQTYVVALGGS